MSTVTEPHAPGNRGPIRTQTRAAVSQEVGLRPALSGASASGDWLVVGVGGGSAAFDEGAGQVPASVAVIARVEVRLDGPGRARPARSLGSVVNDVENLRKRAKQVVRDHRAGLVTVAERLRRGLPRFEGMADVEVLGASFTLGEAQQLIAHELGFASWADLIRASDLPSRSPRVRDVAWRCYAQVFVRDVARSTAWYRDLLGFEVDYSYGAPPFYAQLRRSEAVFNLRGTGSSPWVNLPGEEELLAVRVEVDDVKALFLEVRDKGATIHRSLRTEPWDQVTFVVRDLDGNLISFGSPMPLTIPNR